VEGEGKEEGGEGGKGKEEGKARERGRGCSCHSACIMCVR